MHTLATLYQLRAHLGLAPTDTADDPRLIDALESATAHIERHAARRFIPRRAALPHHYTSGLDLLLNDDLLELTALTNGDGSSINLADVIALPAQPPYSLLRLTGSSAFNWSLSPLNALTVTGLWGWHERPAESWRASADTVHDNPLTSSSVTLTVGDADGADSAARSPRFQTGQLLKLEDEFCVVLAVSTATNTLIIQRAANGTTAADHPLGTPIAVYQPPAELESLALRWAAWLYREADSAPIPAVPAAFHECLAVFRRLRVR